MDEEATVNARPLAAVVGVGTELVTGLRIDTNTTEIASALMARGYRVTETARLADDIELVSTALRRLMASCSLVVVTGGLGPTHDDVTREAASDALGLTLARDASIETRLREIGLRHQDTQAREQLLRQADIMDGASVLQPTTGTAPGQVVRTDSSVLVLLPGPPHEMRPMLAGFLETLPDSPAPVRLRCASATESDVQVRTLRVLDSHPGIELTVLASPAEVEVVLFGDGADRGALLAAGSAVRSALGDICYSDDGSTLAETVLRIAAEKGRSVALAESCTGGMVSVALTDVPGSSDVLLGGAVTYADAAKTALVGVSPDTLARHGAVSAQTAAEMANGVRRALGADIGLAVTGIAGPAGGTPGKPVGTVWFGLASHDSCETWRRDFPGDRAGIRLRSTVQALDALRRELLKG